MRKFVGINGSVLVDENTVTLFREKKLDGVFHELGKMEIPVNQIERIVISEAGLTNGFIAFLRKGDKRPRTVFSALKNKNTIIFRLTKNEQALKMTEYVKSLM